MPEAVCLIGLSISTVNTATRLTANLQSSHPRRLITTNLVYVRTATKTVMMLAETATRVTINLDMFSGFLKFGTTPGGGTRAPIVSRCKSEGMSGRSRYSVQQKPIFDPWQALASEHLFQAFGNEGEGGYKLVD